MYGKDTYALTNGLISAYTTPWAGVGVFHEDTGTYGVAGLTGDRAKMVNFTIGQVGASVVILDPEYPGNRSTPNTFDPNTRPYISKAAGYSYPDLKDFFAGAIDPSSGQILGPVVPPRLAVPPPLPATPAPRPGVPPLPEQPELDQHPLGRLPDPAPLRPGPLNAPGTPELPRVPQNFNGTTYTGDVQNWPGSFRLRPDHQAVPRDQRQPVDEPGAAGRLATCCRAATARCSRWWPR